MTAENGLSANRSSFSTTIIKPPADSDLLLVTVSVEVSAWTLPATDSIAFIDSTAKAPDSLCFRGLRAWSVATPRIKHR